MNANGAAADPAAGAADDAAVVLLAGVPKPNVGLESWLAAPFVAPKVGAGAEDAPKPNTGFVVCVSFLCVAFPKGEGVAEDEDPVFPNENADFGASAGFAAMLDAAPNDDEAELAAGAPKGDSDGPDAGAPNGDAVVVDEVPLVVPNPKMGFAGSAGFAAWPAGPKGDGALDVPDGVPNVGVELDAPPNGPGVEAGALGTPKENGDLAADEEGAVVLVAAPPKIFVDIEGAGVGCEPPATPKLNLGVELAGAGMDAGAEGAVGVVAAAVVVGAGVEEALPGFDATPKLNFSGPDAVTAGAGFDVFAASTVEVVGAVVACLAKENGDGAAGCDGGGPMPMRDNNEELGAAFACSVAFVESLGVLDEFPKGEAVPSVACGAGETPNEKVGCGAVLAGADGAGVAFGAAVGLAKKLGTDEDAPDAGAGAEAVAGAAGFAKKLGIEEPA